jgi:hypothetical protein
MAQKHHYDLAERSARRRPSRRRRKKNVAARLVMIVLMGSAAFAGGFVAMWTLGGWIVGGRGDGGGLGDGAAALMLPVRADYEVEPLVDLLAFRDLAYVPVKGVHVYANRAGSSAVDDTTYLDRIIDAIDWSELNALVITVKADNGWVAYDARSALAEKYGTIAPTKGIRDLDALLQRLADHDIIPIARITCFKDNILTNKRPDMAVQTPDGRVWVDSQGYSFLNPYNHEVWEYVTQIAEDVASRGFREIQLDYVRFPDAGIGSATYPGQYCAKEDAIAGFLAYARSRLEPLGVWLSADVFGMVVYREDDVGIGQKLEKMCENVDIICPMVYPSSYTPGMYGLEYPAAQPYELVYAALSDAKRRLVGTGAKGRPYLQASDDYMGRRLKYDAEMLLAQVRAAEELGFNEWIYWGGYRLDALQPAEGGGVTATTIPTTTTTGSQQ